MATWHEIEVALNQGTIESLDKVTLEAFAQVEPPPSQNPAFHIRFEQAQQRIARALAKIEAKERDEKEEVRHTKTLTLASGANYIAKWAIVIALLALIVAVVQTFWR